jgi:hypothetical protein
MSREVKPRGLHLHPGTTTIATMTRRSRIKVPRADPIPHVLPIHYPLPPHRALILRPSRPTKPTLRASSGDCRAGEFACPSRVLLRLGLGGAVFDRRHPHGPVRSNESPPCNASEGQHTYKPPSCDVNSVRHQQATSPTSINNLIQSNQPRHGPPRRRTQTRLRRRSDPT